MKSLKLLTYIFSLIVIFILPQNVMATDQTKRWTFGPWEAQEVVAWGSDRLIVDFGSNGLWRYDGTWIKLSYLNPEGIVAWGDSGLVVNFGPRGLWKYDGQKWEQIALGIIQSASVN